MILPLLLCLQAVPPLHRPYWTLPVDSVATTVHTHVHVRGRITLKRREADGDTHYKIVGRHNFLVAECLPILPCAEAAVGDTVDIFGISRYDREHGWAEIHPVECLSHIRDTCGRVQWLENP